MRRIYRIPVPQSPCRSCAYALNQELLGLLQHGDETFVASAVIDGHYVLRACIVNFHTSLPDVSAIPEIIAWTARTVDTELRR